MGNHEYGAEIEFNSVEHNKPGKTTLPTKKNRNNLISDEHS